MNFCNQNTLEEFESLRRENEGLRSQLSEFSSMMEEIVKVRKSILERKLADGEGSDNKYMIQLKSELFNLSEGDMGQAGLASMRENIKRFREFMNKIDSSNFNTPLDKAYQFDPDADVDEIKNLKKLKDLVSRIV